MSSPAKMMYLHFPTAERRYNERQRPALMNKVLARPLCYHSCVTDCQTGSVSGVQVHTRSQEHSDTGRSYSASTNRQRCQDDDRRDRQIQTHGCATRNLESELSVALCKHTVACPAPNRTSMTPTVASACNAAIGPIRNPNRVAIKIRRRIPRSAPSAW